MTLNSGIYRNCCIERFRINLEIDYLLSAFRPLDRLLVSLGDTDKAGGTLFRTMAFTVLKVLGAPQLMEGLLIVQAGDVVRARCHIAELPCIPVDASNAL